MKKNRGGSKSKKNLKIAAAITIIMVALFVAVSLFKQQAYDVSLSPSQPTQVKVGVGNAAPTITNLAAIPNVNLNPSPSTTNVIVTFTARDANGANDLVDATASAQFTNAGEPTRTGTCSLFLR